MPSAKPPRKSGVRENAAFGADWDKRVALYVVESSDRSHARR
jgi:hypothetical protein